MLKILKDIEGMECARKNVKLMNTMLLQVVELQKKENAKLAIRLWKIVLIVVVVLFVCHVLQEYFNYKLRNQDV